jgi:hypothetical protein
MTLRVFEQTYAISHSQVYRLHHKGKLTILKRGRRSLIDVADAERFIATLPTLPRKTNWGSRS